MEGGEERLVGLPEHTGEHNGSSGDNIGDSDSTACPDKGFIARFRHFRAGAGLNCACLSSGEGVSLMHSLGDTVRLMKSLLGCGSGGLVGVVSGLSPGGSGG